MSVVALLCPEPLGHGRPAGVGIRFIEFARLLRSEGHDVLVLSPDAGAVEGCTSRNLTPAAILEATSRADVAVVQGHIANELLAHGDPLPIVADLYDPYIVENLHYWHERGDEVFVHDHSTLLRTVRNSDFFLCSSKAQRYFWAGLMVAAGRLNPATYWDDPTLDELMAIVPFGVPAPRPPRELSDSHRILFGGIYDWYDPLLAIEAVAILRERIPDVTLHFNVHPNADVTPQSSARRARMLAEEKGLGATVAFDSWVAYDERLEYYDSFGAALVTFAPSLETDLSMRTRILDWMWAELPVVSSSAAGTDAMINGYGAGAVVSGANPADYAEALHALFTSEKRRAACMEGARRFSSDHQWSRVARPLLDFCADPEIDPTRHHFGPADDEIGAQSPGLIERIARRLGGIR